MATARLPATLRIGATTWTIRCDESFHKEALSFHDASSVRGICDSEAQVIYIKPGLHPDVTREVLHHEVMHAAFDVAGGPSLPDDEEEETFIRVTSPMLVQILVDNPPFVKYLLEE